MVEGSPEARGRNCASRALADGAVRRRRKHRKIDDLLADDLRGRQ
jgi:hypothetical protein